MKAIDHSRQFLLRRACDARTHPSTDSVRIWLILVHEGLVNRWLYGQD